MTPMIRPAKESDVPAIVAVDIAAGRADVGNTRGLAASMKAAVADAACLLLVAEMPPGTTADGAHAVVAWAKTHWWDFADGAAPAGHYLAGITVLPAFRRRGLASELTEARLQWIWERADDAWYVVNARNQASLALHWKWGFREVARGPGFHTVTFDGGEGVLLSAARPLR
ncbi:FR47-like protein [Arthrobacter sp. yr096]|uniref:GNAT family N-acetyltransferase n=1 Tax=Arthrobacter sp. yr096 TaxID=1761750 RepID=UPI0008B2768B|nr:GNAT family N-acetyltransferase [Arthrobacter sp. yr096]SEJ18447.1 FR47-like protein [Arthrobacter sp. yr096]